MAQQRVLEVWSYSDPETAINFVANLNTSELPEHALLNLYHSAAHAKSMQDPAGAMAWTDSLPEQYAQTARQTIFYGWMERSPEEAMQWVEYSANPNEREDLLRSIAPMISHSNIELAIRMYPDMDPDTQSQMTYGIVQRLYENDPASAENWVETLPQGMAKSEGITMLAMSMADTEPERALNMADQVTGELRPHILMQISQSVSVLYPDIFESWLASTSLTAEEYQMVSEVSNGGYSEYTNDYRGMMPYGSMNY